MKQIIFALLVLSFLSACNSSDKKGSGNESKIELVSLKSYPMQPASIPDGTPVQILGYSGGNEIRSADSIIMYEFLCIETNSRDTVKIFTSLISVDNPDGSGPTYTTPHLFDGSKQILEATVETLPFEKEKMYLMASSVKDPLTMNGKMMDKTEAQVSRYLVINHSLPLLIEPRFKTAIACLHFKQQPW